MYSGDCVRVIRANRSPRQSTDVQYHSQAADVPSPPSSHRTSDGQISQLEVDQYSNLTLRTPDSDAQGVPPLKKVKHKPTLPISSG